MSDRIVGAMLGLACGDALGAPAEFKSQGELRALWGTLREMVGGGPWAPGEWTDDTGMALCVAEAILSDPDDPVPRAGERFLEWRKTAKDVGTTISAALSAYRGDWVEAARPTPQARSGKAAGNGSLMRTLPVALAYSDPATMLRQSARLSAMTHWDPQAEVCCALYCLWVGALLRGEERRAAWKAALAAAQTAAKHGALAPDTPGPAPLPAGFWKRLEAVEALDYEDLQSSGYAGYVVECLEAAAWCCLRSDSLEETVVRAVNLAGEADTIAAVAGGAAGAAWGGDAIPARWLEKLHQRDRMTQTAERLAALRRHFEVYGAEGLPAFEYCPVEERVFAGRNPLTARDVETLAAAGVTHLLDLRQPWEWEQAGRFGRDAVAAMERAGMRRLHLPVRDGSAPSASELEAARAFIDEALADPTARVFAHCRAGRERTAAVLVASYACRYNVTYEEALAALRQNRPLLSPLAGQEQAVRAWLQDREKKP